MKMERRRVIKLENVRVMRDGALRNTYLWVENGKIIDPQSRFWQIKTEAEYAPDQIIDGRGCIVAPGFIDVQINGAFGVDFSNPAITAKDIETVAQCMVATGVTAFCPTARFSRTTDGAKRQAANILGLHLEGPFINVERKGAHDPGSLEERYGSLEHVAIVTLAPELEAREEPSRPCEPEASCRLQATRMANVATAIDACTRTDVGPHHPHVPPAGLVLVTDAMAGMGLAPGTYDLAGQRVDVKPEGAFLTGTNTIAGAVLGIAHQKGTLNFGADADFVLLDDSLHVKQTYIAGELVYDAF
ncbi:hypothetical protein PINS_up018286 [Pythium insidiosum]|nr:hypothetical protein PINS_up018286 [Pythium insidiosum]